MGEMVHAVTERAPCDVLIVPQTAKLWSRGIALATDGSPYSRRALQVAAAVAAEWALPLTVIAVAGEDDPDGRIANGWIDSALAGARAAGASARGRSASGKTHEAILLTAAQAGADLVVVGRRGGNPSKRVLLGSTAERVASHAEGPVLIVRADS